jgi:signal transduction histidine kinase
MTEDVQPTSRAPRLVDVVLVVPILAVVILGTIHIPVEAGDRPMDALAYACGIIGALSLLFWRHWGLAVVGIVAVTTAVYSAREYAGGPALLPGPLALLALGYTAPRRVGWIGAAGYVAVAVVVRLGVGDADLGPLLIIAGWASAAVLAGQAVAARGERAAAERERLEHAQQQALATERLRIAQDLHDSVAHAMATINVQSGVAAHLLDGDTRQAKQALEAIRAASSDALDELTAIVSVLRASGGDAPLTPLATLDALGDLVTRARADGLTVEVDVRGDVSSLGPAVSAAAYRVVQEALTNTRRHAGAAARASVTVEVKGHGALWLCVSDDGGGRPRPVTSGADAAGGGFGLIGMRERVEATGGTLDVTPSPEGFEVRAVWSGRT